MSEFVILFITTFFHTVAILVALGFVLAIVWGITVWVADNFGEVAGVITFLTLLVALLSATISLGEVLGGVET